MAYPNIVFNNLTGSDTAASGAGPSTAITGTSAAHTNGVASTTITFTNSPDLSGIAVDGSHALWLKTTSTTRRFSRITAKDDVAKTVTVDDSFTIASGTPLDYAIGGKRKTIENADSVRLFISDAKGGWVITLEDDQPALTSSIVCSAVGDNNRSIVLQGDSSTNLRLLTTSTNNVSLLSGAFTNWSIKNLKFESTAATKTTTYGMRLEGGGSPLIWVENCVFGHPTNKLQNGILRVSGVQPILTVIDCEIRNTIGYGADSGGGGVCQFRYINNYIHDCGGAGVFLQFSNLSPGIFSGNIIAFNGSNGIHVFGGSATLQIVGNIIHGNTLDGIRIAPIAGMTKCLIVNNSITSNTGYGINYTGVDGDLAKGTIDFNNYGTATDSTNNTSGDVAGFTKGTHDLTVAANYPNPATADFSIGANLRNVAYPPASKSIGAGQSNTFNYGDIGAAQALASGGGGLLLPRAMNGGYSA